MYNILKCLWISLPIHFTANSDVALATGNPLQTVLRSDRIQISSSMIDVT